MPTDVLHVTFANHGGSMLRILVHHKAEGAGPERPHHASRAQQHACAAGAQAPTLSMSPSNSA